MRLERHDVERTDARALHPRHPRRHSRCRDAADARQFAQKRCNNIQRHVTFDDVTADERGVAAGVGIGQGLSSRRDARQPDLGRDPLVVVLAATNGSAIEAAPARLSRPRRWNPTSAAFVVTLIRVPAEAKSHVHV
jgi:hypothetical protein